MQYNRRSTTREVCKDSKCHRDVANRGEQKMINGRSVYQKMSQEERAVVKEIQAEVNKQLTDKKQKKATVYDIAAAVTPDPETVAVS